MLQIVQHNTSNQGCEMLERLFPRIRFLFSFFFFQTLPEIALQGYRRGLHKNREAG